jgi:hypothetical protein
MDLNYNQDSSRAVTGKPAQEPWLDSLTRRRFLGCVSTTMALGGLGLLTEFPASAASAKPYACSGKVILG